MANGLKIEENTLNDIEENREENSADTVETSQNESVPSPFSTDDFIKETAVRPKELVQAMGPASPTSAQGPSVYPCTSGREYFMSGGEFDQDTQLFQLYGGYGTGYVNIDAHGNFMPGLYVVGAGSSIGKTTFCYQLADQQAAMGKHTLYFTLEQTKFELYPKSLARGFFQKYQKDKRANNGHSDLPHPSSMDIRKRLVDRSELAPIIDEYDQTVGDRVHVYEGLFGMTVENICNEIQRFMEATQITPCVIIDYLQVIAPSNVGGRAYEGRSSIDHIVETLKRFQVQSNITVILISSLNRSNYMLPVDFESFKESGGIEYSADVVYGLQMNILSLPGFYYRIDPKTGKIGKEKSLKEKREMFREAKVDSPRRIELVCLKNRFGEATYTAQFAYETASDTFYPIDSCGMPI